MAPANQLSRGAVLAFSLVFIAFGFFPILLAAGVVRSNEGPAPRFALAAAGTLFICFGLNMIVDFVIGDGAGPDGDFKPGTPAAIRAAHRIVGLLILGLLSSLFAWAAFGPGPRQFVSTVTLSFIPLWWRSTELAGRIWFGAFSVLLAVALVGSAISGVRRPRRAINATNAR